MQRLLELMVQAWVCSAGLQPGRNSLGEKGSGGLAKQTQTAKILSGPACLRFDDALQGAGAEGI